MAPACPRPAHAPPARVPSNGMRIVPSGRSACPLAARAVLAAALLGLFAFASGCAPVRPWEHGLLAHPTMAVGSLASEGEAHLHAISEGATGGSGGVGSGCGCN